MSRPNYNTPLARVLDTLDVAIWELDLDYRQHGFSGRLRKPFQLEEITAVVNKVLANPTPIN